MILVFGGICSKIINKKGEDGKWKEEKKIYFLIRCKSKVE